ncbi:NAD-dependent epimerase/dehydratase family protein [Protaetiibacter sp. SSC-01]|uniref:NAD-dependent epimerase/dehydratase family protein n=1 Tax=Protaetiibacter sp. SSC-01 TaxID=2759943 RepID=UPI001657176B|nr:NAD-dependent epimerase/dehydratase family protein [Protaetiibacter sp. SSC-01]QNO38092.1 NAD-dependent epimerase/dehydratase family protein [Protaetiibacter sp. SSC-01]
MTSLLVLGATGIIGTHIVSAAVEAGVRVTAVSRGNRPARFPDGVRRVAVDGRDPTSMEGVLAGSQFDAVIDLLSFGPEHVSMTLNWVRRFSDRYVFISSATVSESAPPGAVIDENSPLVNSGWSYPLKKVAAEQLLGDVIADGDLDVVIVRPYIIYSEQRLAFGPWESDEVMARIRSGRPIALPQEVAVARTSVTHAADAARAVVALSLAPGASGATVQVASPETVTWREIFDIAADAVGAPVDLHTMPESQFIAALPHLSGKVGDRVKDRAFSTAGLEQVLPDFRFDIGVGEGYREIIDQATPRRHPLTRIDGVHDRLLSETGVRAPAPRGLQLREHARYAIGRSRALSELHATLRRAHLGNYN